MPRKKTAEELDREIAEALWGAPPPGRRDPDAFEDSDDRFDREWKRQAQQGKTDSFGSAEYQRLKSAWISDGASAKRIKDFIPHSR